MLNALEENLATYGGEVKIRRFDGYWMAHYVPPDLVEKDLLQVSGDTITGVLSTLVAYIKNSEGGRAPYRNKAGEYVTLEEKLSEVSSV